MRIRIKEVQGTGEQSSVDFNGGEFMVLAGVLQQHMDTPTALCPDGNIEYRLFQRLKPLIDKARKAT